MSTFTVCLASVYVCPVGLACSICFPSRFLVAMVIYTLLDVRQVVDPHYGLHVGSHDGALNCKATGGVLSLVGFVIMKTQVSISLSYN